MNNAVHHVFVTFALEGGDVGVINLDRGVDGLKKGSKGWDPAGLEVGKGSRRGFEDWVAHSGLKLGPGKSDAEEGAGWCVGAPEFKELHDLAFTLDCVEGDESRTSKVGGSMDDGKAGVAIVPTFRQEHTNSRGMNGVELLGGKEAVGEDEADGPEINGLIKREGSARCHRAASGLLGHESAFGAECGQLGLARTGGGSVVTEGLVCVEYGFRGNRNFGAGFVVRQQDLVSNLAWAHAWGAISIEVVVDMVVRALGQLKLASR